MASSAEHYEQVLSRIYTWMCGGFEAAVERNAEFFRRRGVRPRGSGIALDLGAGSGFQSIPLARAGFRVTAVDLDSRLLEELAAHAGELPIEIVHDDLLRFAERARAGAELAVCMTDTLLHLGSKADCSRLFRAVQAALEPGGRFIVTYRPLDKELEELDRFIAVRSDDDKILTCFLEFETETVKVHDLVYLRQAGGWVFEKSWYRKLRLSPRWVEDELRSAGFEPVESTTAAGFVTVVAVKEE